MTKLTRRQRIRIRSYFQMTLVLLAAAVIVAGVILLIVRAVRGGEGRAAATSEAFVQSEEAAETPAEAPAAGTPEAVPTPPPEPAIQPPEADLSSWELRLVRKDHPLPADYVPELTEVGDGQSFDARAAVHLRALVQAAESAGYTVFICSGYRSYDTQYMLYWGHVEQYQAEGMTLAEAEQATSLAVNYPGGSEHQLGLAADLLEYQGQDMEPWIGGSGLMLWLEEHCADYGFIIRYPDGKTDITGVEYEPWHLRFVGSCARFIMENDLTLEEFLALYD